MKILLVDDEKEALLSLKRLLKMEGFPNVDTCNGGNEAIVKIKENNYDIVLLDLLMPDMSGIEVLEAVKPFKPETEFIMNTAVDDIQMAVKATKLGAYDYLIKPIEEQKIILAIQRAYERKGLRSSLNINSTSKKQLKISDAFNPIITNSIKMKEILSFAQAMAGAGNPILVTGESGTGKDLLARGIHKIWAPNGPFVAVNVASVPETLFESQFFGHIQGAFTGAQKSYTGYFKQAHNGTLFLDEIGELPLNQQVKFLRVLEEKMITPIGDTRPTPINVKIISATNMDIDAACREGKFRLDLLYRLRSAHVKLPPLRERENDVPLLANHFLKRYTEKHKKKITTLSNEVLDILMNRKYPGNIREFSQTIENAVILANGPVVLPKDIGELDNLSASNNELHYGSLKDNSEEYISRVLTHTNGDKKKAAKILGISLRQVQRKVAEMKKNDKWAEQLANI